MKVKTKAIIETINAVEVAPFYKNVSVKISIQSYSAPSSKLLNKFLKEIRELCVSGKFITATFNDEAKK